MDCRSCDGLDSLLEPIAFDIRALRVAAGSKGTSSFRILPHLRLNSQFFIKKKE